MILAQGWINCRNYLKMSKNTARVSERRLVPSLLYNRKYVFGNLTKTGQHIRHSSVDLSWSGQDSYKCLTSIEYSIAEIWWLQVLVTPVRRSARKSMAPRPSPATQLHSVNYAYMPNPALSERFQDGVSSPQQFRAIGGVRLFTFLFLLQRLSPKIHYCTTS